MPRPPAGPIEPYVDAYRRRRERFGLKVEPYPVFLRRYAIRLLYACALGDVRTR